MYSVHHEIAAHVVKHNLEHVIIIIIIMHTVNYHCSSIINCSQWSVLLLTSCIPVNNIVLEYKTKSINHISSPIFIPSMLTVRLLKASPNKRERDLVSFETEFHTQSRGGLLVAVHYFWPQPFQRSLNISLPVWLSTTLFHTCAFVWFFVLHDIVLRALRQGSPVLRTGVGA